MLQISKLVLVTTVVAGLVACGPNGTLDQTGNLQVVSQAVTAQDVAGILYEIVCDDGTTSTEYVPMEDEGLPEHIDLALAGQPFADLFMVLPPGDCTVTATAMLGPGEPAPGCASVTQDVTIVADETTEVVLVIECEADPVGALDVIVVVTDAPSIVDISYDDSKFILQCEEVNITVSGGGGLPPLTYAFAVITAPIGANYTSSSAGGVFTFYAETPGMYEVTVTVTDANGSTAEMTFPIHVSDDPNIEHCGEICCQLADGHLFFGDVDACETAGGAPAAVELCEAEICCKTPAGPMMINAASCPQGAALPAESCMQDFCCKSPDGLLYTPDAAACEKLGGVIVADEACMEEVCCKTGPLGNVYVPVTECPPGQVQPADLCEPQDVCCQREDGTVFIMPEDQCEALGAVVLPLDKCLPETCCKLPDGTFQTLAVATCDLLGGTSESEDLCKEICCIFQDGTPAIIATVGDCQSAGGVLSPITDCEGSQSQTWQADYTLDPDAPCDPEPYLVVPSSGANKLAVYDLQTLLPLPTSPFDTCSNPSRVMMDANTDVYASCREGTLGGRVRKNTRDGVFLWETQLTNCTGARGIAMSGDGRLFAVCSAATRAIFELAPATGAIIQSLPLSNNWYPYGVTPSSDALYVAYLGSGVTRIDLATFTIDWDVAVSPGPYGISADGLGGVWIGGSSLQRLDSAGFVTDIIDSTDGGTYPGYVTGVQVALDGTVNGALYASDTLIRHDPIANTTDFWPADVGANQTYGVTADANDNIYTINRTSHSLTRFDTSGTATGFGPDAGSNVILVQPYGYSGDMTGITSCANGTTDFWFSSVYDSGSATTTWNVISWVETTPPGSSVNVYYSLDGVTWTLATNGQTLGVVSQTFQVKAILQSTIPGNEPTLTSVSVTYTL